MTQPNPKPNNNPDIADLVLEDIKKRKELGIERYGVALQANNGRDSLLDAYEEILDLTIYIKQKLEEDRLARKEELETPTTIEDSRPDIANFDYLNMV